MRNTPIINIRYGSEEPVPLTLDDTQYDSINKDMQRILNKLIAIVKTTKQNMEKK